MRLFQNLSLAQTHVDRALRSVVEQRRLVERLIAQGHDATEYEVTLQRMAALLDEMIEHRDKLEHEVKRRAFG